MLGRKQKNNLKRNVVFIDTSAITAILNKKDNNHKLANRVYKKLQQFNFYFVLTNFVIAETHATILLRTNIKIATDWLTNSAYKDFNVFRPEEDVEKKAVEEINKYQDKDFSLTDMLSFLIMDKVGIQYYFAYDEHFEQIGKFSNVSACLRSN